MRRRKAGLFGFFLLPSGFVKTIAGGLAVVMVLTATGDSAGNWLGDRGSYAWLHGPGQIWGEAAGAGTHVEGRPENRTLPASTRGRYPKQVWDQKADNTVTEAEPPPAAEVKGFDEKSSTEQAARRTDHERVYTNTDGTETTEFSTSKLNYRGKDGAWTPIDPTLVDDQGKGWRNAADEVGISFAKQADAADLVTLTVDENHSVSYTLAGAAASTPKVDGATITYPAVRSKVDLKLESRPGGVKETLVLSGPDAPTSFTFPLRLKGLTPRISDGQVVFTDEKGATRAVIPPGDMVDAKGVVSKGVAYRLAGGALELTVDAGWLAEPGRAFPVAVDPTVQLPVNSGSADASMTAGSAGSGELAVGSNANAYIKFGDLVNRLQFHTIFGAQLWMVNFEAESCAPRPVSVHPVTENWSSGSGTYPGPAVGGALASKSFAHGYIAFGESSSACPRAGELFNLGGAGRDLVQRWVNGEQPNYGLSIRGSGAKKFTDRGTANPPKLYVTHSPYNATYKLTDPRPNPPVLQNQDGKVKIQVTNKSASAWAPGDYYLAYRAYKADGSAFGQQRAANLTTTVQRNGKVTLDATIKAMPPGKYFLDFTMVRTGGTVFTDHQVPPGRIILQVFDIPPVLQELFPPNGYQAPTLTPQLWARALDVDAPPSVNLQFKFEICERDAAGKPINCTNSGYGTKTAWTVPAGTLSWSKAYLWRAFVKDATTEVPSQYSTLLTNVPQPEITARVSSSPGGLQERDFDPQTGNFTTSAVDAAATTAGPALSVTRTYNSIDSRRDGMFGAGWTSVFDMKVVPDDDGSGSVVVTYADGQTVRFGRNANGTYVPPTGRTVSLTQDSSSWKLLDQSGTTYQFALTGKLSKITDVSNRSIVLTYQDGKLRKAQVANSQTNTAGRSLTFTWTGNHVTKLDTDPVGGAALSWNYSYTGDLLTKVCGPTPGCTNYEHSAGSHYRSAVLDSRPESYWRLGEDEGTTAASEVATNLGKDSGTYRNVTLNAAGALAGTTDTAASFNGTSSTVDLPKGTVKKSRDGAVELWFRNSLTGSGGPLIGYQDKALGSASTTGVPVLYVGTDGKLRGQFGTGSVNPITSPGQVNEGRWHHVVLSSMGSTQTLYLDGVKIGELTGKTIDHSLLTFNQIGAAYASTPGSWPAWGTTAQKSYNGMIDDVALYSGPLGAASVAAHYQAAITQADLMSKVTLPSGRVDSIATYDVGRDRVKQYTDGNGGVWKVGAPTVYGGDTDLRRSIEVLDPGNRTSLYEFDALSGQLLRLGMPLGMETRSEDKPGEPAETPPDPVRQCTQPDPNDPAFCTVIPDDSGGPVFVRYGVDGLSIRTFEYNDDGVLTTVRDENGNPTTMTYDARGNVTSTKTCRDTSANQCNTSYKSYPATVTNLYDPRNNLPTESRDARSASATDNTYRIQYAYHPSGQLATQTSPDGTQTSYRYTTGGEGAVGGGTQPAGLVDSMTNARGKITKYAYYANGDLAKVTEPSGRSTEYTYDALGRMISKKDVSDSFTAGVVTTYTYDGMSRLRTTTLPVTTNAVTNVKHQKRITNTYDSDGNVTAVEVADALGNDPARITSSTLDEHGRTITTTDPEGGQTWFDHDAFGNVTSTTDPNGNRYDFAYTGRNTLAEVRLRDWRSDPAGAPATTGDYLVLQAYSYDFAGRLASRTDAMGRRIEYTYFDDGLLAKAVLKRFRNPDGTTRDYVLEDNTYDGDGNPTRQVTANGKTVKTSTYDKLGRVATSTADPAGLMRGTAFTYDSNGNVKTVTTTGKPSNVPWVTGNSQEQVTYDYDDADNVTQETISNGTVSRVTRTRYDQRGLATSTIDPRGNAAGADPNAFTARLTYDEIGQLVTSAAAPLSAESGGAAASTVTPTATTGYNTFGELVDHRDELGNVSRTAYDRNGRVTSSARPPYQAPGAAQAVTPTTFTKYDGNSNVVEVKDPRGNITRTTYDQLNRVAKVDAPASANDERAITTFGYTRTGRVLSTVDPTGIRTEATFDDLDRQVTTTSIERVPAAGAFTSKVVYDDASNVVSAITPKQATTTNTYDALNQLTKSVDPNGVQVQYGYDFVGHTVRAADAQGRTSQAIYDPFGQKIADNVLKADGSTLRSTTYGYDLAGNLITVTDPNQTVRTYTYNSANQLISQVEPVADNKSITSSYGVDAAGHRTRYTDGRGNSTITTYNSLGLPESTIDPPTTAHPAAADRTWTTGYDENGNAVQMTAPGGVVTRRDHDAANRPKSETGTGAEAQTATTTYSYDLSNRLRSVSAVGGTNTYLYDDRGNLFTTAGPGGVAEFRYDEEGSVVSRKDAAGTAAFGYDKGRLDTVADGLTGTSQKFGYDNTGAIKTIDFGAGRKRTLGYDDFARLSSDVVTNSANGTVASTTYGYNPTDTLASRTTTGVAGAGTTTYDYDKGYRLKSSTSGGVTTGYEWDDAGNRTKIGSKQSTFDERNRLLSDGDSTYTYTPRGTLRSKTTGSQTQQFGFDALDRMITAGARTYAYDGLDRVATRDGTTFTYAGQNDEIVSDGSEKYARGPSDELVATGRGDTKRLSLSDAHGDVVGGFDPADTTLGALPDSTTYDPFGKVTAKAGNTGALGFQGDWTDQSTGQVDMGARWYDPSTGGFVSRDDVDTSGGSAVNANRYGYGAGNPVSNTDPTGHYCQAGKGYTVCAPRVPVHITPPKISWWSRIGKGAKWGLGRISIPAWFAWQVLKPTQMPYDGCERWSGGLSCGDYYKYSHNPQSVRDQFCDTHAWTKQCGGGGASPWELANEPDTDEDVDGDGDVDTQDDAAARAEAARIAAYLRAKAISDKARADNAAAAKNTPIAVSAGATKPILLPGDQVSSTPDAPAGHVGAQRDVVDDARADANDVYQRAVQAAGQIMHNVSSASRAVVVTINTSDERHRLIPDQRQRQKRDCRQSLPTPNYMPVDSAHGNRATGVEACITDLSERNEAVRGPGYEWTQKHVALNYGVEASKTINSCHLLAAVLGGDGSRYENVATCSRAANTYVRGAGRVGDNMRRFEASAADAVRGGQVVYYKVIPQYAGDRTVPVSFEMTAEGFYKDGRPGGINKHEVVPNFLYNPRGHRGNTPGMTNLGLLQDLDGRPAPTGFTK